MARLNTRTTQTRRTGPLNTTASRTPTHEGGSGHALDLKTQLFTLAVTNMVGESTFYESATDRDERFAQLVANVTVTDPDWVAGLVGWLRSGAHMRTASIVAACEYIAAGGPNGRRVISSACQRADEPGEVLAYWHAVHGRNLPQPVKRGVADAAVRLYSERSLLKYDTPTHGYRFGDVIELTHPQPRADWQSQLFRHAIDRRHGHGDDIPERLTMVEFARTLNHVDVEARRALLASAQSLAEAGMTWERLSGWLPGGMDAEAWEAVIPTMGYMATLRNLRNFEEAAVRTSALKAVARRIADPDEVARSRQLPFRFWTAYRELAKAGSVLWAPELEQALEHSCANIPKLKGRTLVMVDTSASMWTPISGKSTVMRAEVAALFGAAVGKSSDVEVWPYASGTYRLRRSLSVLGAVKAIYDEIGKVGHGTNTWPSVVKARQGGQFDRVVVFTDMQDHWSDRYAPTDVPVYVWDLAGYGRANISTQRPGHYLMGGFSDQSFKLIALLEAGRDADWPWL